jgi:hypothetical protein
VPWRHNANSAPGTDPGRTDSPYAAYCSASIPTANSSPVSANPQLTGLRGRRATSSPPSTPHDNVNGSRG